MTIEEHFQTFTDVEVGQYDNLRCLWQGRKALVFTTATHDPANARATSGLRQVGELSVTPGWSGGGGYCYGYTLTAEWLPALDDGSWEQEQRSVRFDRVRGTQRPDDEYWLNVFEALIESAVAEMAQHVG